MSMDLKTTQNVENTDLNTIVKRMSTIVGQILNEANEMKDIIRRKQWIEEYHKNNVGTSHRSQYRLQEKRMLELRVCLKHSFSIPVVI